MFLIKPVSNESDLAQCLSIREEVFCKEQGVSIEIEHDEEDTLTGKCVHFMIYNDAKCVGTFRISINRNMIAKLQRFCILKEERRSGAGRYAMEFIEGFCAGNQVKKIMFDAQCTAVEFYKKLGYSVYSDEFEEAGIMHVKMSKRV